MGFQREEEPQDVARDITDVVNLVLRFWEFLWIATTSC